MDLKSCVLIKEVSESCMLQTTSKYLILAGVGLIGSMLQALYLDKSGVRVALQLQSLSAAARVTSVDVQVVLKQSAIIVF